MRSPLRTFAPVALFALIVLAAVPLPAAEPAADHPRRLKVLFLGDDGHHRPLDRLRQVFSEFTRRGIDFTYTDRMEDLSPATLAPYDALLLYANVTRISADQEKALLDFVASGKGFVPVHCGSYCFLNSPRITALTGARFKSHGTGVFRETHLLPDHPVLKGLKPIESWDESYVHELHNEKDRTVLATRDDDKGKEPYTWVRTHGRGRVFYTAWGHDHRTWGNADFLDLLERGIRWSCGDAALTARPPRPDFVYEDAGHPIPNYLPGRNNAGGDVTRTMPRPLSPAESMKRFILPAGFSARLVASEPAIKKPVCMTWDERGRLWVAETYDYPNELQPDGRGRDRITICQDTDADGVADKFTVFADGLSIPTSILHVNGGLLVMQAPHTLFLKDTDGDDVADVRKVLFSGWGTDDTHAGPSNLRYGFDNWVYGTVGYSGFRGTVGGKPMRFGQGLFRMRPDGSVLEFLASTTNNTWGLGLGEDGLVFGSTANGNPSFHLAIPNRFYESVRGLSAGRLEPIADTHRFWSATDKVRQVDFHGSYTAGAGHALYAARSFPQRYWNRIAFVAEPTGHLVGQFVLQGRGADFVARNDFNLLASDDEWTSPIVAEVGPDGAVWVIDWYNYIVQHNPIPRGFQRGKGNAYETPLRDKRHGRIYRIVWDAGRPSKTYDLSKATDAQLVEALRSDNQLWRMHAQRLLVERKARSVVPELLKLAADASVDEIGLNAPAVHALWTLHGLGQLDAASPPAAAVTAASGALAHRSPGVRRAALDVLPRTAASAEAIVSSKLLDDPDPQVRKAALLALAEMPASDAAGAAIYAALARPDSQADRFLADAAAIAASRHDAGFLKAAFAARRAAPRDDDDADDGDRAAHAPANLIPNPSFEQATPDGQPVGWRVRHYNGRASHALVTTARTGRFALQIQSTDGADSSWFIDVPLEPQTQYRLSGYVKAIGVRNTSGRGGLLNLHGMPVVTRAVAGTSDWTRLEVTFNSGTATRASLNCLFGGWGRSTGTVLYDDLELVKVGTSAIPGIEGRVLAAVVTQYAQRGPADSVVATVAALRGADERLARLVLDSLATHWPAGTAPALADAQADELRALHAALPASARDRLLALADRWGRRDLFAAEIERAAGELATLLADARAEPARRADAARRVLALADTDATVESIVAQLVRPNATPQLLLGLIESLAESKAPALGKALIGAWPKLTPTAQGATLNLLLRRDPRALLDGLDAGTLSPRDLQPQHWQTLTAHPDRALAERATKLQQATGLAPTADRKEVVERYLPVAQRKGDAEKGKAVFANACAVCHSIEGQGGAVGPDLTGVGARPRADILLDILDPNRSVEGTYRQWVARTRTGDVISGRLFAETQTSVEILDAEARKHVLRRQDLRSLQASSVSVMPEGFESSIPPDDMVHLLEYLSTSKVKH